MALFQIFHAKKRSKNDIFTLYLLLISLSMRNSEHVKNQNHTNFDVKFFQTVLFSVFVMMMDYKWIKSMLTDLEK